MADMKEISMVKKSAVPKAGRLVEQKDELMARVMDCLSVEVKAERKAEMMDYLSAPCLVGQSENLKGKMMVCLSASSLVEQMGAPMAA